MPHTETVYCARCDQRFRGRFCTRRRIANACPRCCPRCPQCTRRPNPCPRCLPNACPHYSRRPSAAVVELVEANDGLVWSAVKAFVRPFTPNYVNQLGGIEEFHAVASVALLNCARQFDERYGCKFSTYAFKSLRYELADYVERESLRCACGVPVRDERRRTISYVPIASLDGLAELLAGESQHGFEFAGKPPPLCPLEAAELRDAVGRIDEPYRTVLRRRFWRNDLLSEIAADMELTVSRVLQLQQKAIAILANKIGRHDLLAEIRAKARIAHRKVRAGKAARCPA